MSTGDAPPAGTTEQIPEQPAPGGETAIQPDADPGRIPLPPMPVQAPTPIPESFFRKLRFLDGVLALLLVVVAFFLGSFRAANSDIYQHLAVGRELAGGAAGAMSSYVAEGRWANHAWLYDLLSYLVFNLGPWGGAALVVVKALLGVATAWFVLRAGTRPGGSSWVAAVFAMIAMLAISPRLLLQPTVASMLLLAVTVSILARAKAGSRSVWLLPLVCALWVNLDGWFLLGPAVILLFLLGELIERTDRREGVARDIGVSPTQLALVLAVSVAACLANPYGVNALAALPVGIVHTGAMGVYKQDPVFWSFFISPFERRYFSPYLGLSAAGLSYFVLLALGALSFALTAAMNLDGLRWWRVLLWLGGAALSAWNYRAIPFFAVLAAPVTALNFLDLAVKRAGAEPFAKGGARRWAVSGRAFTAFVGVILAVLCVPGWLHSLPHYRRQVGWGIETDPALRDACLTIKDWQEKEGSAGGRRWYNTSPDAAYYMAWFCPGEQTYVDARLELFTGVAGEFATVRKSLAGIAPTAEGEEGPAPGAWRKVFADHGVQFVVFHNSDPARSSYAMSSLARIYNNPDEFAPCFTAGTTALFAWRDPRGGKPAPSEHRADFNRLAFGKDAVKAPDEPPADPNAREWWRRLLEGEGPVPSGSLTAMQHTVRFDALGFRYQAENNQGWIAAQLASLVGSCVGPSGPIGGGAYLPSRMQLTYWNLGAKEPMDTAARDVQQTYLRMMDMGPIASLHLAIRGGRAGLLANPEDVLGQIYLAEAYSRLAQRTRERSRTQGLVPHAGMIRQAQVTAALNSVLQRGTARPEQQRAAHELLFNAQSDPVYFEARVRHLSEFLRLAKVAHPAQVPQAELPNFFKGLEGTVKEMRTQLKQRRDQYEVQAANKPVLDKARIALENGLAETALKLLENADPKDLRDRANPREVPGATLILSLLLGMGQTDKARVALTVDESVAPESRGFGTHPLGVPAFEWFQVQLGAATGDYDLADRNLAACIEKQKVGPVFGTIVVGLDLVPASFAEKPMDAATAAAMIVGGVLLREAPQAAGLPWQIARYLPIRLNPPPGLKEPGPVPPVRQGGQFLWRTLEQQAELWAVRAWLALEAGRTDKAREYARQALALAEWRAGDGQKGSMVFRSRPLTELILSLTGDEVARD